MPVRRRRPSKRTKGVARKRYFSGRRSSKRKYKARKFAKRVSRVLTSLCEKKRITDTQAWFGGTPPASLLVSTWYFHELTRVGQGSGVNERIGNDVRQHHVTIKGQIRVNPTNINGNPFLNVRCMVIRCKSEQSGSPTAPDITKILDKSNGLVSAGVPVWSFYNRENIGKYTVLMDKVLTYDMLEEGYQRTFVWRINLKGKTQVFGSSTSTSCTKGAVFLATYADTADNTAFDITSQYEYSYYFTDM